MGDVLHLGVAEDSDDAGSSFQKGDNFINGLSPVLRGLVFLEGSEVVFSSVSLVESSDDRLVQVLGEEGLDFLETSGGIDVSDNSDDNHPGAFDDGNGLDDFFLVKSGSGFANLSDDVSHTSFESNEGGKMNRLRGVVLGKLSYLSSMLLRSLSGKEPEGSTSGMFKFFL